ncbi:unnamed protein product [Camellia sinensis]
MTGTEFLELDVENGIDSFSRASNAESVREDEDELLWAALSRFSSQKQTNFALLRLTVSKFDDGKERSEAIDVRKLDCFNRELVVKRALATTEQDNYKLLSAIKECLNRSRGCKTGEGLDGVQNIICTTMSSIRALTLALALNRSKILFNHVLFVEYLLQPEQLNKIFELCGSPDEIIWPGVSKIPWYNKFKPTRPMKRRVRDFDCHALDLLEKMLTLDPSQRISAKNALDAEYFWTDPLPCDPRRFPDKEKKATATTKRRDGKETEIAAPTTTCLSTSNRPNPMNNSQALVSAGPSHHHYGKPRGPPRGPNRYPPSSNPSGGYYPDRGGQGGGYSSGSYPPRGGDLHILEAVSLQLAVPEEPLLVVMELVHLITPRAVNMEVLLRVEVKTQWAVIEISSMVSSNKCKIIASWNIHKLNSND